MRLTVHVADAVKETIEVTNKDKTTTKKTRIINTLSYRDVTPAYVDRILGEIQLSGLGTPTKHYLSGERITGKSRGKKKS